MSGPKVVRIVTREELIDRCEGLLAQLDGVAKHWTDVGRRNGTVTDADIEQVGKVGQRLRTLLEADRFKELQLAVPKEIAFLTSDRDRRLQQAAATAASASSRRRRFQMTAESLLAAIRAQPNKPRSAIIEALESVRSGSIADLDEAERAIARAVAEIGSPDASETLSEAQRNLAKQLGDGLEGVSFSSWLAENGSPLDKQLRQIDGFIAELELREDGDAARSFTARAEAITDRSSHDQRQLLADSLLIDLAARAREVRATEVMIDEMARVHGELQRIAGSEATKLAASLARAIDTRALEQASHLITAGRRLIEDHHQKQAAENRRKAVLGALQKLGYEVREGMETATPHGGRLVLRNSTTPEYGAEINLAGNGERMQMRPVAFRATGQVSSQSTDLEFESTWCGQFDEIRELIGRLGGTCKVEQATPVGVVPLKVVATDQERDRRAELLKQRPKRTLNR